MRDFIQIGRGVVQDNSLGDTNMVIRVRVDRIGGVNNKLLRSLVVVFDPTRVILIQRCQLLDESFLVGLVCLVICLEHMLLVALLQDLANQ